jgi:hypothetical protein
MTDAGGRQSRSKVAGEDHSEGAAQVGQAPGGLRALARQYSDQSLKAHQSFDKHAHWAQWTHLAVGIIGVVAGVVAGTAAITEAQPLVAGIAAFTAAAALGLQTFLNPQKSASENWARAAGLAEVSRSWEVLANAYEKPTKAEFDKLLAEWKKRQSP